MFITIGFMTINLEKIEAIDWNHSNMPGKSVAIYLSNTTLFLDSEEEKEFRDAWETFRIQKMTASL